MYRRKSLQVTIILTVIGIALAQLQGMLYVYLYGTGLYGDPRVFALLIGWTQTIVHAVVTFFVVAWALRSVGGKVKRDRLTAQDVLDALDEEEIEALKRLLIPPSQRVS
jgi:hypothetical protein